MDVPCADLRCGGRQHFSISLGRLSTGLLERRRCVSADDCLSVLRRRVLHSCCDESSTIGFSCDSRALCVVAGAGVLDHPTVLLRGSSSLSVLCMCLAKIGQHFVLMTLLLSDEVRTCHKCI
eukprot:1158299-Pelagomonas_calceolata.AAC.3